MTAHPTLNLNLETIYINVESSATKDIITLVDTTYTLNVNTIYGGNIEYIREIELIQCSFPVTNYNFSESLKNNKFYITRGSNETPITIPDGFYLPDDLANEIEYQLNQEIYQLYDNDISANLLQNELLSQNNSPSILTCFKVFYNKVTQRFIIGNTHETFTLTEYDSMNCLSDIGFNVLPKEADPSGVCVGYVNYKKRWLTSPDPTLPTYNVKTSDPPKLLGPRTIYMKLFNQSNDQILFNNIKLDSSKRYFAKIPISNLPYAEIQDSKNGYLQNKVTLPYNEPYFINKLSFSFWHFVNGDEKRIYFENNEFNFTLKIVKSKT
jgi:hypothetical protein